MNKPNAVEVCERIMESLLKRGFSYEIPRQDIEKAILWIRGMDKRTVNRWIEVMEQLEYIELANKTKYATIYRLNVVKVPNLFAILRNQPQTHLRPCTHTQSSNSMKGGA